MEGMIHHQLDRRTKMSVSRRFLTALTVLIAAAGSLSAQNAAGRTNSQSPFAENATAGVHLLPANAPIPYALPRRDEHVGTSVALMIVGGASIVTGAIISGSASSSGAKNAGDIFMISGALVGLYGLFRYLR
jgi:heme A synthase